MTALRPGQTGKPMGYSIQELQVVVLSRDFQDGEVGGTGAAGMVPEAAIKLAQLTRCPNLLQIGGGGVGGVHGPEAMEDLTELIASSTRGLDFWFYSGIQQDKFGNINLHYTGGKFHHPRFRGPGVANVSYGGACLRFYIYPTSHTRRNFVEQVDFISVPGNIDGPDGRRKAGLTTDGPRLCVTPLAVMDFDKDTGRMRLRSVHEGVSADEVVNNTGFDLIMPDRVEVTPPPTEEELYVLRHQVDPEGRLRS